ncbi:MAG TPA: tail-specific protease, partial [Desulfuromonas sp.]|nr:tail-specific protease [Desulfuromonas sp.]
RRLWSGLACLLCLLLAGFFIFGGSAFGTAETADGSAEYQANRAKLISYTLREELTRRHFSHKPLDNTLSMTAFDLYLKQLDGQKRFLLQADIARLRQYAIHIDEELNRGVIELPAVAAGILAERVLKVRDLVQSQIAAPVDFRLPEEIETDPEKLDFCADEAALRERWRKIIKFQLLSRLLNLQEEQQEEAKDGKTAPKKSEAELLAEARSKIAKNYEQFFARMLEETRQDHFDRYFDAVSRAFDPHTNYLPPTQREDFDISMRGSLEGIGATLREEDGYIKVIQIIPGSAAWRQGRLKAEDTILKVAEGAGEPTDVTDMRLRDAVSLIRGKKGTEVRLTVKKADGTIAIIPIIRDVVQIEETFVKSIVVNDDKSGRNFGYIRIPSFYRDFQGGSGRNATDDTRRELEKLAGQQISGLIVDLRDNGGGALTDAVAIAGLFISKGPIVQVVASDGKSQVLEDEDPAVNYAGPLVVLVNQFSASASEILAAALQDYRRAIVIGGAHTHGKGTVQAMLDLDRAVPFRNMDQYKPLGALKMTIQKFYRVSGGSTQSKGVIPDIVLPDRLQHLKTGEQYIDNALPWDTIAATPISPWPNPLPETSWLANRSRERISKDAGWAELTKDVARAKERSDKTQRSLNIDKARRERAEERKLDDSAENTMHGDFGDGMGKTKDKPALSEEEKRLELVEKIRKDPVDREAMAVLGDLLSGKAGPLAGTAGQAGRKPALVQ